MLVLLFTGRDLRRQTDGDVVDQRIEFIEDGDNSFLFGEGRDGDFY